MTQNILYPISYLELVLFYGLNAFLTVETLVEFQLVLKIFLFLDLQLYLEIVIHYFLLLLVDERMGLGHYATDLVFVLVI